MSEHRSMRSPSKPRLRFSLRVALLATTCVAAFAAFVSKFADRPLIASAAGLLVCAYLIPLTLAFRDGFRHAPRATAAMTLGLGLLLVAGVWSDSLAEADAVRRWLTTAQFVGALCIAAAIAACATRKR